MREVTKQMFDATLSEIHAENSERLSMGLEVCEVTTKEYEPLTGGNATMIEYYAFGMLFAFEQNGHFYTNGF